MQGAYYRTILFLLQAWASPALSSRYLNKMKKMRGEWREGEKVCRTLLPLLQGAAFRHPTDKLCEPHSPASLEPAFQLGWPTAANDTCVSVLKGTIQGA